MADYATSARLVADVADYVVVNVSSPNTPGLRDLQAVGKLGPILVAVRAALDEASPRRRVPLLVKIAPDLADPDVDAVAALALEARARRHRRHQHDGRPRRPARQRRRRRRRPGRPVRHPAEAALAGGARRLHDRCGKRLTLIAAGGITTPADAEARLAAGATLLQAYTAFVYEGPFWPRRVQRGLAARLRSGKP